MKKLLSVLLVLALIILPLAAVVTAGAAVTTSLVAIRLMDGGTTSTSGDPKDPPPPTGDTEPPPTGDTEPPPTGDTEPPPTGDTEPPPPEPTTTGPGGETNPPPAATTTRAPTSPGATTTRAQTNNSNPLAAPANLNSASRDVQLKYFNDVAQNVRTSRPGFVRTETLKIDNITLDGLNAVFRAVVNPVVNMVKNQLMPGNPVDRTYAKGADNKGEFFSENDRASGLTASDITGITSTKSGDGWRIEVKIRSEKDPAKGAGSANSRIYAIASKQEVLSEILDLSDMIEADLKNATLEYHSGYAWVIVNAQGRVTSAGTGFQVTAIAREVKIGPASGLTITAPQSTVREYKNFIW